MSDSVLVRDDVVDDSVDRDDDSDDSDDCDVVELSLLDSVDEVRESEVAGVPVSSLCCDRDESREVESLPVVEVESVSLRALARRSTLVVESGLPSPSESTTWVS
ncbi:hypothetical protein GCM10009619_17510 [Williamsia maris]